MTWLLAKELILKQLHFIVALIVAVVSTLGWFITDSNYTDYKLEVATEQLVAKDKIIERQTDVNKLTERLIETQSNLEQRYADSFNIISTQLADLRNNSDRVRDVTKEIRTTIVTNTDATYSNDVATTYTNLYDELRQSAERSSEQADRATEEAFKQYESCKLMVDEYNRFKTDSESK